MPPLPRRGPQEINEFQQNPEGKSLQDKAGEMSQYLSKKGFGDKDCLRCHRPGRLLSRERSKVFLHRCISLHCFAVFLHRCLLAASLYQHASLYSCIAVFLHRFLSMPRCILILASLTASAEASLCRHALPIQSDVRFNPVSP